MQRRQANYIGQYLAQSIGQIPEDEIQGSLDGSYPTALVIAAQPYREQVINYLEESGYEVDTKRDADTKLSRDAGLEILNADESSNIGWRIVLWADEPQFLADAVTATADNETPLVEAIPQEYRNEIQAQVKGYVQSPQPEATAEETPQDANPVIKVTSFEGAKGLSAQYVYLVGLHNGELPRDPNSIQDLEICKFVVGLTRTRKKCTLIHTRNFGGNWKTPSSFLDWINPERLQPIEVDAAFWRQGIAEDHEEGP